MVKLKLIMASRGGGDVPAHRALPERSVEDAASVVGGRMPGGYQPQEVLYGWKLQNNTGGGGCRQVSPASPVSSDIIGANQSKSLKNLEMNGNAADRCSGRLETFCSQNILNLGTWHDVLQPNKAS